MVTGTGRYGSVRRPTPSNCQTQPTETVMQTPKQKPEPQSERIYPRSWIACVVVWLLDRLPQRFRTQVLDSYWTEADIELAKIKAEELCEIFGVTDEPPT